ncbi:MAG: glycosyltransferase family A protein [Dongiaceae bacterium]
MLSRAACIIPTHGRPGHLARALDSALGQSSPPAELIVVDDLDDGPTAAIVQVTALRTEIPMRRVVNRLRPGASGSRNAGAAVSRAEFLAFLDDDDAWRPDHLACAMAELDRTGADAAITGICRIKHDGTIQRIVIPVREAIEGRVFEKNFGMTGSNLVIRRSTFDRIGRFDPALPVFNDWDFLIRMMTDRLTYCVVPNLTVEWREHEGDRISTPTVRRADGIERFIAKHRTAMSALNRRDLTAVALGIRRRNARSLIGRLMLAAKLLRLLGLREAVGRRLGMARRRVIEAGL